MDRVNLSRDARRRRVVALAAAASVLLAPASSATCVYRGMSDLSAPATDSNEYAVGAALNAVRWDATGDMVPAVSQLAFMTPSQEAEALAEIAPVQYGALPGMQLNAARGVLFSVEHRLSVLRDSEILTPPALQNPLLAAQFEKSLIASTNEWADAPRVDPLVAARWGTWAAFHHSDTRSDAYDAASGRQPGVSAGVLEASAGAERRVTDNLVAGFSAGWSRAHMNVGDGLGWTDADTVLVGTYGSLYRGGLHLDWYGGGGVTDYDMFRAMPALGAAATSRASGYQLDARLNGGWDVPYGRLIAGPAAGLEYHHLGVDGFTESGAGPLNLAVGRQYAESLASDLGFKASRAFTLLGAGFDPSVSAAWRHEYVDQTRTLNAAFDSGAGPSFAVQSADVGDDSAIASLRLDAKFSERLSAFAELSGEFGRAHERSDSWGAGAKLRF